VTFSDMNGLRYEMISEARMMKSDELTKLFVRKE